MTNETCEERERLERMLNATEKRKRNPYWIEKLRQHISTCPLCKGEDDE